MQKCRQLFILCFVRCRCVQENIFRQIPHLQAGLLFTPICKVIDRQIFPKGIKSTDENDVCFLQLTVMHAFTQHVRADHALVIADPQRQFTDHRFFVQITVQHTFASGHLHFNIGGVSVFILHIQIKPGILAAQSSCHCLFRFQITDCFDLYVQDTIQKSFAKCFVPQRFLKQKIVLDGHRVPVNFSTQNLTFLSDRHDSSAVLF